VLWAAGRMPWQFALPAGTGDVATGIVAIVVAVQLAQNASGARRATYVWCLFGIADLVVAIAMGAMTSPGRPHLLAFDAPNLLISSYPLVMVPTFGVPLALMLHGLVLLRLRREAASAGRLAAA
jgi:hypothetical protein